MQRKLWLALVAIVLVGGVGLYVMNSEPPADTRFSGAYRLDDGMVMVIAPREGTQLRFKLMTGETGALWPTNTADSYEGGAGWAAREPVVNRIRFQRDAAGKLTSLTWQRTSGTGVVDRRATRLPLREEFVAFESGELTLRGKLVLPEGAGPFAAVVPVHGSEDYSAVDHYDEPYMHAANGIASFVYDKRGTGGSDGHYTANFDVLSDDVVAAVRYLRQRKEIDGTNIHLAGYSQGGWIAPLAALKDGHIRSLLIGYGVAVPVLGEDRWGYVYAFQRKGFGDAEIGEMDAVAAILGDIFDRGQDRWDDFERALEQARTRPWFETAKHSDSIFGMIVNSDMPLWVVRPYIWWKYTRFDTPFIDRLYDPAQTLARLDIPSLWIFAGKDSSAPTQWSIEALEKLRAAGKPIEYFIYPDAEHGIVTFKEQSDGEREVVAIEPGYLPQRLAWFRKQSGL